MVLRDALEQFDIFSPVSLFGFGFLPVNLNITHFFIIISLFFWFRLNLRRVFYTTNWRFGRYLLMREVLGYRRWLKPRSFTRRPAPRKIPIFSLLLIKSLFALVVNILKDNVLQKKNSNISFVFFLFLTLLFLNIAGLFPFTFTVTSSFVVTLFFSLTVFLAANIMGLFHNGFYLLSNFLPTGTPLFIAPLLILIEIISYFSRIFSLSIRLFANMLSGHGLLKILIGFSFAAFKTLEFWFFLGFLPWLVVTVVLVLEVAIAFLQAYVFIILTAIYINDAINPH